MVNVDKLLIMKGKAEAGIYAIVGFILGIFFIGTGIYSVYKNSINDDDEEDTSATTILSLIVFGIIVIALTQLRFYAIRKNPSLAKIEAVF